MFNCYYCDKNIIFSKDMYFLYIESRRVVKEEKENKFIKHFNLCEKCRDKFINKIKSKKI